MTVQDAVRTVTVPQPAAPSDAPLPPRAAPAGRGPVTAPLLGRDRPLLPDERQFVVMMAGLLLALEAFIVVMLVVATHVWS